MNKILLAAILIVGGYTRMYSYDFEVNGICYNIKSMDDLTVEVTSGIDYVGDIIIPKEVIYKNRNLKVVGIGYNALKNAGI